ncbi:MAG: hypothetical protein LQ352_004449 [Teloschistes flavicans]|nr:MAG: hypothetical protein LQ352_004449 [Teloschistes flavicans]
MPPKRKQTPDMPTSPPKRVTRARAKKDIDVKPETHITTASARASAKTKKNNAEAIKTATDLPEMDEDMTEGPEKAAAIEEPVVEAPKTRGKSKVTRSTAATSAKITAASSTAPAKSTRSNSNNTPVAVSKDEQPPKPRGRPKKAVQPEASKALETVAEDVPPEPPVRATRGRAAAVATKPMTTRTRVAAAAPKKKVKFDDQSEQDKENQPLAMDLQEKPLPKATGLRAKPVRKPAAAKTSTRRTKTKENDLQIEEDASKQNPLPLSPKKVTQVAKTPSLGSEDELAPAKTPLKPLTTSPSKIPTSVNRNQEFVLSRLELNAAVEPQSPKKHASPARLAVSPRKPPPSPFKDALKQSPRKFNLSSGGAPPQLDAPPSPSRSPLKEPPKRLNIGDLGVKPMLQWSKTPMKSSLLQSPARRPGGSAMKTSTMFSSSRTTSSVPTVDAATALKQVSTFKLPELEPGSAASSPLRATTPAARVHDSSKRSNVQATSPFQSPSKQPREQKWPEASQQGVFEVHLEPEEVSHSTDELTTFGNVAHDQHEREANSMDLDNDSFMISEQDQEYTDVPTAIDSHQVQHARTNLLDTQAPMQAAPIFAKPAFVLCSSMIAGKVDESESEDELSSPQKSVAASPLKSFGISTKDFGTVGPDTAAHDDRPSTQLQRASSRAEKRNSIAMTPLALQMGSWLASSPEKKQNVVQRGHKRGIFSPAGPVSAKANTQSPAVTDVGSPAKVCFFDDEMAVREADDDSLILDEGSTDELEGPSSQEILDFQASQDSQASEVYGDENAAPEGPNVFVAEQEPQDRTLTCTPARVFEFREIHTVSKVPLRPAADDTPLKVPRKRSRSLAGPLSDISMPDRLSISRDSILSPILHDVNLSMSMLPGDVEAPNTPETPTAGPKSAMNTPGRSIRKAGYSHALKGAVVHVDVHTTEGADASGIFVDLLTQMGARCVKQWHWNPQTAAAAHIVDSPERTASPEVGTPNSKIGITHVVYKDGGKRTLEKVREAKGAVLCVGVGWVLDCEREDKWLNEAEYAVDTSIVPRGGSRRRKSMEPRALANLNGNLIPVEAPSKAPIVEMSPTKEFLTFDTPASRRETFEIPKLELPATPAAEPSHVDDDGFGSPLSPTTPYYLSKGAKLVQQTCPPKQVQELFFPLTGKIEDQPNEAVRQRLLMARRKSLQWTSKVQSPLGRTVSYGK